MVLHLVNELDQLIQIAPQRLHRGVQGGQLGLAVGDGGAGGVDLAGHGLQHGGDAVQIAPQGVGVAVYLILAVGDGVPGLVQLIQTVGGGVQAAAHVAQGVQQHIQTVGQLVVVVLQIVLALAQLGDLLQLAQGGGHHQEGHAAEGEVLGPHPDGEVPLLPGEGQEQHRPQVAHQLHLGAGGLQRQDVVLVEDGHGLQSVVVAGVLAGPLVGDGVHVDLHHALGPSQVLRLCGQTVQGIVDGQGPGQLLKGLCGLALKVEVAGCIGELEHRLAVRRGGGGAVGEVVHLVVLAVVGDGGHAVGDVALHHAAVGQVSVVVGHGVIGLVIQGGHAVADGLHRAAGQGARGGQHRGKSCAEPAAAQVLLFALLDLHCDPQLLPSKSGSCLDFPGAPPGRGPFAPVSSLFPRLLPIIWTRVRNFHGQKKCAAQFLCSARDTFEF